MLKLRFRNSGHLGILSAQVQGTTYLRLLSSNLLIVVFSFKVICLRPESSECHYVLTIFGSVCIHLKLFLLIMWQKHLTGSWKLSKYGAVPILTMFVEEIHGYIFVLKEPLIWWALNPESITSYSGCFAIKPSKVSWINVYFCLNNVSAVTIITTFML